MRCVLILLAYFVNQYSFENKKSFKEPSWSIEDTLIRQGDKFNNNEINKETLLSICNLAYLSPKESKIPSLCNDINDILWSVEQIQQIDTTSIPPLLSILDNFSLKMRKDLPRSTTESFEDYKEISDSIEDLREQDFDLEPNILEIAKEKDSIFYVVPKQKQVWEE